MLFGYDGQIYPNKIIIWLQTFIPTKGSRKKSYFLNGSAIKAIKASSIMAVDIFSTNKKKNPNFFLFSFLMGMGILGSAIKGMGGG